MDLLVKKSKYFITKFFLNGFIVFILYNGSYDLFGALNCKAPFYLDSSYQNEIFQKEGFIKGRITQITANAPVCFADIFNSNKTSFTKSNSKGEFILGPLEFPATLRIRKFGFKDETIIINNPVDSVLISLTPLEVHKSYSGNKKLLQYELIFKKALEKFQADFNSGSKDHSQRELVYCRISSSIDSSVNSLFDSYAQMNVSKFGLQDFHPYISRYASTNDYIPGLTGNRLEFNIDPYVNLPVLIERFITRKGYIVQDNKQIALVGVDLKETKNVYFINVADTSIVYITSHFKSKRKNRIQGPLRVWQDDRNSSTEISFSCGFENKDIYLIDCISANEKFSLINKNKPLQTISKSVLFVVMPDSSMICNAVRDQVSLEVLTEMRQQINFRAKYLLSGKSSVFDSETEKLLSKPYRPAFWAQNSYVTPDIK